MATAGFCSVCGTNVWLTPDGSCANGHDPTHVSHAYETTPDDDSGETEDRARERADAMVRNIVERDGIAALPPASHDALVSILAFEAQGLPETLAADLRSGTLTDEQRELVFELISSASSWHLDDRGDAGLALVLAQTGETAGATAGDTRFVARMLARQNTCLHRLGRDYDRVEVSIREARAWAEVGELQKRANSLVSAASLAQMAEDPRADSLYEQAVMACKAAGDTEYVRKVAWSWADYLRTKVGEESPDVLRTRLEHTIGACETARAHVGLARLAADANDRYRHLARAVELDPTDVVCNHEMGFHILLNERDDRRAYEHFSQCVAHGRSWAPGWEGLGLCLHGMSFDYLDAGDYESAIDVASRACDAFAEASRLGLATTRMADMWSDSYNQLGLAYIASLEFAYARECFEHAARLAGTAEFRERALRNLSGLP